MLKNYRLRDYGFKLVILVIAIASVGVLAIGSASPSDQSKQLMGLILGVFIMLVVSAFDYTFLLNFYWVYYILNILLLVLVAVIGDDAGGAQRWVSILGVRFQPSEMAKLLLILFYAQFIMKYRSKLNTLKILISMILFLALPLFLVLRQPDLSTSVMLCVIFCVLLFAGGLSYKIIFGTLAVAIPTAVIIFSIILQPDQKIIKEYQQIRILAWLQPEKYATTQGYQQLNSEMAIGSGQLFGKGLNNNVVASVKNGNFISEPQTDFIFAVIGEELGFLGSCLVIILLLLIALECLNIARKAKDLGGALICCGMAAIVGFQSFMNIAVAVGLMPNTGIPLPFVSYGLTSLWSLFIGMGFVLNVKLQCIRKYNN